MNQPKALPLPRAAGYDWLTASRYPQLAQIRALLSKSQSFAFCACKANFEAQQRVIGNGSSASPLSDNGPMLSQNGSKLCVGLDPCSKFHLSNVFRHTVVAERILRHIASS
ncbi:MAG: hypothetical protein ACT6Q7_08490 [Blastomonas fulva]|uniref:hypothetical protein n=1 Tax=Blastomonas fulva TaxID=1550728 RepID=UPI0040337061